MEAQLEALSARLREVEARLLRLEGKGACEDVEKQAEQVKEVESLEYALGTTLWDAPVLLGLPQLGGHLASALLALSMILVIAVQFYVTIVLLLPSSEFITPTLWKERKYEARRWRLTEGHEYGSVDAIGTSLAARVCGEDGALSVAYEQASLVGQISRYLSLSAVITGEFPSWSSSDASIVRIGGTGPILCMVCIILFVMVILKELRRMATSMVAILFLPRGRTHVEGNELVSISLPRLLFALFVHIVQGGIAGCILVTGTMWLTYTADITELILNAAALGFIMDLDGMVFEAIVPAHVQKFVSSLQPLRYKRPCVHQDSWVPLILLAAFVAVVWQTIVVQNSMDMFEVYRELCGGRQDFAVQQNPSGYIVSWETQAFTESTESVASISTAAVEEFRDFSADHSPFYSVAVTSKSYFVEEASKTLGALAETGPCEDLDKWLGGAAMKEYPAWFMAVRFSGGLHRGKTLQEARFYCADYKHRCLEDGLTRLLCPETCGCSHPTSGQVFKSPSSGCPKACLAASKQLLRSRPCSDLDVANSSNWTAWWRNYHEIVRQRAGGVGSKEKFGDFVEAMIAGGCNETTPDPVGHEACDESAPFRENNGLSTILGFCPRRCCSQHRWPDCPELC